MIFYFSATGNSEWVAKQLADILGEVTVSVNDELRNPQSDFTFSLSDDERIGFVFPIHSWGVPSLMVKFIKRLKLENYAGHQVFAVCTCGDDAGYTNRILSDLLKKKNLTLESCHTVQMPNSYIVFPFFDVDSDEVEHKKVEAAPIRIRKISKAIVDGIEDKSLYNTGSVPRLKTNVIYPLFKKYTFGQNPFTVSDDCIHCRLCAMKCPANNIRIENDKPVWGNQCVQCLACVNHCPKRAIDYGKITKKKGRYHFVESKYDFSHRNYNE
ncbi:MAG TPA: EFR1 family ferrodoxin [Candidatus Gracilibacteria bacterium]|nr:EFR1 family ferrodoxin [Candidatus Gracilibacteria bacterium]